ncbi:MAG: tetratricopeptide repeat protein [Acidobacteriota bacterium]
MKANRRVTAPFPGVLVLITSMLLVAADAGAQRGGIRGRVVDEHGDPLEGVEVLFELVDGARPLKTKTNAKGQFVKAGLRLGDYRITCSLEGYEVVVLQVRISFGRPQTLDDVVLAKLPEGTLTETTHRQAQDALDAAAAASEGEDHQAAIDSLKKFLELVPDSAEAHFNIAASYEKMGDAENALSYYQKAVELNPELFDAWVAIADLYSKQKKWKEGMAALEKALEIRPGEPLLRFNYGAYAFNAGDMALAQESFQELIELNPDYAMAYYQLAMVMVGQGKNDEAIPHFEKYLELEPEGANAATAQGILEQLKKN